MIGQTISHYRITEKLGEGGMGVVYKAEDTTLDRIVALKFLPSHLVGNAEIRKRFEREAKAAAALHHPNICPVYEIDEVGGKAFIAMAFIEGESLDQKITQGPLKLDQALDIAQQIAKGLEAAHKKGIFHRDIKPANIIVGEDGHVTIMDFGVAQLTEASRLTQTDEALGTIAYMSPEQTEGSGTDHRTDIWSLGVVLYEMITGQQPFMGDYDKAVMYSILNEPPEPLTAVRSGVSMDLERLTNKSLAKDRTRRYQSALELRVDLEAETTKLESGRSRHLGQQAASATPPPIVGSDSQTLGAWRQALPWTLTALLAVALAGSWLWPGRSSQPPGPPAHVQIALPPGVHLAVETEHPTLALSPDGSRLVFVGDDRGTRRLYMRDLAQPEARPLEGTEGAASPFFSPDGEWIAFFDGFAIKKVSSRGGIPEAVYAATPVSVNRGAAWSSPDTIVIAASLNTGLQRGSIEGDRMRPIDDWTLLTGPTEHYAWPGALSENQVLFTDHNEGSRGNSRIAVLSIETGGITAIANGGTNPRYSSTGHVLFARSGSLYSVPIDADRAEPSGPEARLLDGLMTNVSGAAHFAVASTTLAYAAGDPAPDVDELVWVDREGRAEIVLDNGRRLHNPRLSPDGARVAIASPEGTNLDLWMLDLARLTFTRLTSHPGEDFGGVWSPDGQSLAFASEVGEDEEEIGPGLAWMPHLGAGPERLLRTPGWGYWEFPSSWSPDGRWLAYKAMRPESLADIYLLPIGSNPEPVPFVQTEAEETAGMFSPDGSWIAYMSDMSGTEEVYVRPFPGPGAAIPISAGGGVEPVWSRSGRELFYWQGNKLMVVNVGSGSTLDPTAPRVLFEARFERSLPGLGAESPNYDVSLDGTRFLMIRPKNPVRPTVFEVVFNWPVALGVSPVRAGE